jgi:ABC-type dipeptide/oligopeptide/nickel transport system ATPase component
LDEPRLRALRGNAMAMIYQDPMTTLNPVFNVGEQIAEAVRLHRQASRAAALARAVEMLELVGIPDPARCAQSYPHQLSGGMRQRAVIAMALACHPKLLIADEPTTALDVTIQAQVLDLMRRLQRELGTAIILITHDLGVIADLVDTVVVIRRQGGGTRAGEAVVRGAAPSVYPGAAALGAVFGDARAPHAHNRGHGAVGLCDAKRLPLPSAMRHRARCVPHG